MTDVTLWLDNHHFVLLQVCAHILDQWRSRLSAPDQLHTLWYTCSMASLFRGSRQWHTISRLLLHLVNFCGRFG